MKRFLSISLLSVFLVSATELYQLVKLPLLVAHFKEHKQEDPAMTLWKFLAMHYDYQAKPDEDHDQDMKLPFKANDSMINSTVTDFVPAMVFPAPLKNIISTTGRFTTLDDQLLSTAFLSTIWQPPKSC